MSTLKITTFNVGLLDVRLFGRTVFEFTKNTRKRAELLPEVLYGHECDILCLQELYHAHDFARVQAALRERFPFWLSSKPKPSIAIGLPHGLAVFSRFPLRDGADLRFRRQTIDEGLLGPRGYLSVQVEHSNLGIFSLINTHTTAGGFLARPESAQANAVRSDQLHQLFDTPTTLALLIGDLNCGPEASSRNYTDLLEAGFVDPYRSLHGEAHCPTWDPTNPLNSAGPHSTSPPQRIDHILLSGAFAASIRLVSYERSFLENLPFAPESHTISDHSGVTLVVESIP